MNNLYDPEDTMVCTCDEEQEVHQQQGVPQIWKDDMSHCACKIDLIHRAQNPQQYGFDSNIFYAEFHGLDNLYDDLEKAKCICDRDLDEMMDDFIRREQRLQWFEEVGEGLLTPLFTVGDEGKPGNHLQWLEDLEEGLLTSLFTDERDEDLENTSNYVNTDAEYRQWMKMMGENLLMSLVLSDSEEEEIAPPLN